MPTARAPMHDRSGYAPRRTRADAGSSRRAARGPLLAGTLLLLLLVLLGAAVYSYDHGRRDLIAPGVRIGNVDVGGLRAAAARARVEGALVAPLRRPVRLIAGARTWTLTSRRARVVVDTSALVAEALRSSRSGTILTRTWRGITGGRVARDIPFSVSYSHSAVRRLDTEVAHVLDVAPRNASVQPGAGGLQEVASRTGVAVDQHRLRGEVAGALVGGGPSRTIMVPTRPVAPAVTSSGLATKYPSYIVVDRSGYTLRFYDHLRLMRSYPIAVGMQGLETPAGLYNVQWKQVDPPWYVPNSAWAGSLAGKVIPPGPQDPLKARFMSFDGGAGIHGIDPSEYSSIGHSASHGCVRMRIPDVIDLYDRSPVGTPVYIL